MTLGEKIIQLRKDSGYKQNQLASLLGITATRLNYWEKDKRVPDNTMIENMSNFFCVPPTFFLGTGIFKKWDLICEYKDTVITLMISSININSVDFSYDKLHNNLCLFIATLDILIKDIEFENTEIRIFPKILINNEDKLINATNKKEQLINNYEKLNDKGKEKLLEYSKDLVASKNYIEN